MRGEVAVAPTKPRADRVRTVGVPVAIAFAGGFVLATASPSSGWCSASCGAPRNLARHTQTHTARR